MSTTPQKEIARLRDLLQHLKVYHGAHGHFVRLLQRQTGKTVQKNFVSRILRNELNFSRGWYIHLSTAIIIGEELVQRYRQQMTEQVRKVPLRKLLSRQATGTYLEQQLQLTNQLYDKGDMLSSRRTANGLFDVLDLSNLEDKYTYTYADFALAFSRTQMQFGDSLGERGALTLARKSIDIFSRLREKQKLIQAVSVKGHVYRQLKDYDTALAVFTEKEELIKSLQLPTAQIQLMLMNIAHQRAITLMRIAEYRQQPEAFAVAKKYFQVSNQHFEGGHREDWYKFTRLREAELYVKSKDIHAADKILGDIEDPVEVGLMMYARTAIFFRINTEKYLKIADRDNGLKYFTAAVKLAAREQYQHELEQLEEMYLKYTLLQKNLPENFSVYDPIWN